MHESNRCYCIIHGLLLSIKKWQSEWGITICVCGVFDSFSGIHQISYLSLFLSWIFVPFFNHLTFVPFLYTLLLSSLYARSTSHPSPSFYFSFHPRTHTLFFFPLYPPPLGSFFFDPRRLFLFNVTARVLIH